jgi:hypothetical protein
MQRPVPLAPLVAVLAAATLASAGFLSTPPVSGSLRSAREPVQAAPGAPAVRATGILINAPLRTGGEQSEELAFFGTFSRTSLAIELVVPQGGLIDLDRERSQVTLFTDDQGTNLLDAEEFLGPIELAPRIAADGRSLAFVVGSKALPHRQASRLRVQGKLLVRMASERVTHETKPVSLSKGSTLQVGPFRCEVSESEPSPWGGGWSTTLVTRQDPSAIVAWTLVDEEGVVHEWPCTMSMDGGGTWYRTFTSEQRIDHSIVRIEAWKDVREGQIPFELEAGLGLR